MRVVEFGRSGTPVVYLPSSGGDETEFERYGMPEVAAPWIESGAIRVFSADARGPHGLFDPRLAPPERMRAYVAVERYLADELLPWVLERTGAERVTLIGSSYGAFVAANLLFKEYSRVEEVCGLGGVYEMWHRLDGYHDQDVYFHTPFEYLPRLTDPEILDGIRATRGIRMFAARDDEWVDQSLRLDEILRAKRLPGRCEVWPSPADHHERWWRKQLKVFLADRFPR
jgi:esterase/lipase superfamily enzyme